MNTWTTELTYLPVTINMTHYLLIITLQYPQPSTCAFSQCLPGIFRIGTKTFMVKKKVQMAQWKKKNKFASKPGVMRQHLSALCGRLSPVAAWCRPLPSGCVCRCAPWRQPTGSWSCRSESSMTREVPASAETSPPILPPSMISAPRYRSHFTMNRKQAEQMLFLTCGGVRFGGQWLYQAGQRGPFRSG